MKNLTDLNNVIRFIVESKRLSNDESVQLEREFKRLLRVANSGKRKELVKQVNCFARLLLRIITEE